MMSRARTLARMGVAAAGVTMLAPGLAAAQYVDVPQPAAYALRGVTVVQPDGRRQDDMTVVVRGRFIERIARGGALPADAELLEGDSLMVYPALVDGEGKAAHEFPRPEIERREVELWDAPRALQGFMPARRLVAHLTADGEDVAAQRREGILAAAVHPEGAMMGGRGALLLYRPDAETPEALVIRPELGPKFELRGGQGVYPATLFGVIAFVRQAFEDARHHAALEAAHERDPRGMTTPAYDPDRAVLQDVLAGRLPVFFEADRAVDILRVIGLADEYGFDTVIVGGGEAWQVADELRRREIPVLVAVNFAEPRRWDPEAETESQEPLDAAAERERLDLEDRYANAGRLAQAGVRVALTSGGTGEVLEGARKAIEYGLDEAAALAALTITPAELYGIPHVPRIEERLPATFIVTSGPLFDEDTRVTYTFVEGRMEAAATGGGSLAAGDSATAASFGGLWRMTVDAEGQIMNGILTIEHEGATFTGTMELEGDTIPISDGVINGNEISATGLMTQGGQTLEVEITGTVEGDEARGEADAGPLGVARWTARRTGPGGER